MWILIMNTIKSSHATHTNHRWLRTEIMDGNGLYILDWKIHLKEIFFRVTVNTRGFIGLGFSQKTGRMSDADLVLAWVDDRTGKPTVLVCVVSLLFLCVFDNVVLKELLLLFNKLMTENENRFLLKLGQQTQTWECIYLLFIIK